MKNYYTLLGVTQDADIAVIKAACKVLLQRYHPDKFEGDTHFAEQMTRNINDARDTLCDAKKRRAYDIELEAQKNDIEDDVTFTNEDPFSKNNLDKDWSTAISFAPELKEYELELRELSWTVAEGFKAVLLIEKQFKNANVLKDALKNEFLKRYFGHDIELQSFGLTLIKIKARDAALALNRAANIFGYDIDAKRVKNKIIRDFNILFDLYEYEINVNDFDGSKTFFAIIHEDRIEFKTAWGASKYWITRQEVPEFGKENIVEILEKILIEKISNDNKSNDLIFLALGGLSLIFMLFAIAVSTR